MTVFRLLYNGFLVDMSLFSKTPFYFIDAEFFPRSSYGPRSSSIKNYDISAFKRIFNRPSSYPRSKFISFWISKWDNLWSRIARGMVEDAFESWDVILFDGRISRTVRSPREELRVNEVQWCFWEKWHINKKAIVQQSEHRLSYAFWDVMGFGS